MAQGKEHQSPETLLPGPRPLPNPAPGDQNTRLAQLISDPLSFDCPPSNALGPRVSSSHFPHPKLTLFSPAIIFLSVLNLVLSFPLQVFSKSHHLVFENRSSIPAPGSGPGFYQPPPLKRPTSSLFVPVNLPLDATLRHHPSV